jgi:hypothetical protein
VKLAARRLWAVVGLAVAHFALWYASALVAYGFDLDHLPSRSALAGRAAELAGVLQFPHDRIVRALPVAWLQSFPQAALVLVLLTSLAWGAALLPAWRLCLAVRSAAPGRGGP